jgi:hypothetical protein
MQRSFLIALAVALLAACGEEAPGCRSGSDCASGVCRSDRTCAPAEVRPDASEPADASEVPDAGEAVDAGTEPDAGEPFDAGPVDAGEPDAGEQADAGEPVDAGEQPSCVPNRDGVITRAEFLVAPGQHATFRVARDVSFDTRGVPAAQGGWLWDLSGSFAGDTDERTEVLAVEDLWFADDYAGATYAAPMSGDLLAVFELTPTALLMRGMASAEPDGGTKLVYTPPVTVLSFPFKVGDTWSTSADASGTYDGSSLSFLRHDYESKVDAAGELRTPLGSFPVLRISTSLDYFLTYQFFPFNWLQSFAFVAECYGTVASITSQELESDTEFDDPSEIRRIAP